MTGHEEYTALLDALIDGELTPADAERVQRHIDSCPQCRAYLDDALAIRAAFPDVEETEVPEGFAEGVLSALPARRKTIKVSFRRYVVLAAACLVLFVALRGAGGFGGASGGAAEQTAAGGAEEPMIRALPAEPEQKVTMDAGTAAVVPYSSMAGSAAASDTVNDEAAVLYSAEADGTPEAAARTGAVPEESVNTGAAPKEAAPQESEPVYTTEAAEETLEEAEPEETEEAAEDEKTILILPPEAAALLTADTAVYSGEDGSWYAMEDDEFRTLLKELAAGGIQPLPDAPDVYLSGVSEPNLIYVQAAEN